MRKYLILLAALAALWGFGPAPASAAPVMGSNAAVHLNDGGLVQDAWWYRRYHWRRHYWHRHHYWHRYHYWGYHHYYRHYHYWHHRRWHRHYYRRYWW